MTRQQHAERYRQLCNLVNNRRVQLGREPLRDQIIMRAVRLVMGAEPKERFMPGKPNKPRKQRPTTVLPQQPRDSCFVKDWPKVWAVRWAHKWQRVPGIGYIPA